MEPIRTESTTGYYRGDGDLVGDLPVCIKQHGVVGSVWQPSKEERRLIAKGANIQLFQFGEPIHPVQVGVTLEKAHEEQRPLVEV